MALVTRYVIPFAVIFVGKYRFTCGYYLLISDLVNVYNSAPMRFSLLTEPGLEQDKT